MQASGSQPRTGGRTPAFWVTPDSVFTLAAPLRLLCTFTQLPSADLSTYWAPLRLPLSVHIGTLAQRLPTEWSLLGGNGPALTHCLVTLCLPQPTVGWMEREGTLEDISQLHSPRQHDQSSLQGALNGTSLHLPQTPTVTSGGGGGRDTVSSCSGGPRPLVELCVEPAGLCGRCTGVSVPLRVHLM